MKANPVFSLYIPTKLVFGCGEIKKLSSEKLPGKRHWSSSHPELPCGNMGTWREYLPN